MENRSASQPLGEKNLKKAVADGGSLNFGVKRKSEFQRMNLNY